MNYEFTDWQVYKNNYCKILIYDNINKHLPCDLSNKFSYDSNNECVNEICFHNYIGLYKTYSGKFTISFCNLDELRKYYILLFNYGGEQFEIAQAKNRVDEFLKKIYLMEFL
jgi:hypothetical protein